MSEQTRDLITWTIVTLIGLSTLIGLAVRFVLLPWLRDHLVMPMRQVEKQVSENAHTNTTPTLLDRLDDVQAEVKAVKEEVRVGLEEAKAERLAIAHAFDGHLAWSDRWVSLMEREIDLLKDIKRNTEGSEG